MREFEYNGIKQQNRNGLLERDPTVDGLKTGHTDSAGYLSGDLGAARRHASGLRGARLHEHEGAGECERRAVELRLFTFYDTKLVVKGGATLASAPVWKAAATPVDVGVRDDVYVTVPRGQAGNGVKTAVELQPRLIAPLARDADRRAVARDRRQSDARDAARAPLDERRGRAAGGAG